MRRRSRMFAAVAARGDARGRRAQDQIRVGRDRLPHVELGRRRHAVHAGAHADQRRQQLEVQVRLPAAVLELAAEHADLLVPCHRRPGLRQCVREVAVQREEGHAVRRRVAEDHDAAEVELIRPHRHRLDHPVVSGVDRLAGRLPDVDAEVDGAPLAGIVGRERLAAVPAARLEVAARAGRGRRESRRATARAARGTPPRARSARPGSRRRRGSAGARTRPTRARGGRRARGSAPARSRGSRSRVPRRAGRRRSAPTWRAASGSGRRAAPARPARAAAPRGSRRRAAGSRAPGFAGRAWRRRRRRRGRTREAPRRCRRSRSG